MLSALDENGRLVSLLDEIPKTSFYLSSLSFTSSTETWSDYASAFCACFFRKL